MNILEAIPGIGSIIDKVVTSPKELEELKIRMAEIDAREVEARLGVQKEWLGNKSVFVAGAIPMILWMISVVVLFNCIVSPLLSPVWKMPTIELPEWYSSLAGTIIVGLFTKKAFDGNAINIGNLFSKPAKGSETHVESEHRTVVAPSTQEAAPAPAAEKTTPAKGKDSAPAKPKPEPTVEKKRTYETQEEVDARFDELVKEYEGKGK